MYQNESRDRAEMKVVVDEHLQIVLEFMQRSMPAWKLIGIAEALPQMARLLWGGVPQEPCTVVAFSLPKTVGQNPTRQASTESSPVLACEHGGSEAEVICR